MEPGGNDRQGGRSKVQSGRARQDDSVRWLAGAAMAAALVAAAVLAMAASWRTTVRTAARALAILTAQNAVGRDQDGRREYGKQQRTTNNVILHGEPIGEVAIDVTTITPYQISSATRRGDEWAIRLPLQAR